MHRRHRPSKHHRSSNLLRSTPDLSVDPRPSPDSSKLSARSNWRTSSANAPRSSDSPPSSSSGSPLSRRATSTRVASSASPRHNRSSSFRTVGRPTPQQVQSEEQSSRPVAAVTGFRPRGSTMPSDSASRSLARRRMRSKVPATSSRTLSPNSPPVLEPGNEGDEDDFYLCRSFSINSKGGIVSQGDFVRQRSRSNNSVASSSVASSTTPTSYSSSGGRGPSSAVRVLGATGVGKTTLVSQFMNSEYMASDAQDEDLEKCVSVLLDGVEYELVFSDCLLSLDNTAFDSLVEEADAFIVAYSVTDRSGFEKAVDILFGLRERGITASKAVILVGNKSDLARTREIAVEEGKSIAKSYECKFIETSAAINHNVDELLVGMVSQIRLKNRQKEEVNNRPPVKQQLASPSNSPFRKGGGSMKGSFRHSMRSKGFINRLLGKNGRSKSCDNLHVL